MDLGSWGTRLVCALALLGCGEPEPEPEPEAVVDGAFRLAVTNARIDFDDVIVPGPQMLEDTATLALTVELENLGDDDLARVVMERFDLEGLWTVATSPIEPELGEEQFPLAPGGTATVEFVVVERNPGFDCEGRDGQSYLAEIVFFVPDEFVTVTVSTPLDCRPIEG